MIKSIRNGIEELSEFIKQRRAKSIRVKGGRYYYYRGSNESLFLLLEGSGFFEYHVTNISKGVVTRAQVVHWISSGWKAYINGSVAEHGKHEINHQNGKCWMDYPSNLIMMPVWLHRLCTKGQRRVGAFVSWKSYQSGDQDLALWNSRGRRITNTYKYIEYIVASCILKSVGRNSLMKLRALWISSNIGNIIKGFSNLIKDNFKFIFPGRKDELNLQRASELF